MSIDVGTTAPLSEFEAYVRGESAPWRASLRDLRGSWVVLVFYPRDFSLACPTELEGFAELHAAFEVEDAEILAASTDTYWSHKAWFESDHALDRVFFPVVADPDGELTEAFGVLTEDGAAQRATFVLDPEGVVRHVTVTDPSVGRSPAEVLRTLQALRTGDPCAAEWTAGTATPALAASS
jgi:peroxiredoxin (alkyl hydroperoxide reductase subunit C)